VGGYSNSGKKENKMTGEVGEKNWQIDELAVVVGWAGLAPFVEGK